MELLTLIILGIIGLLIVGVILFVVLSPSQVAPEPTPPPVPPETMWRILGNAYNDLNNRVTFMLENENDIYVGGGFSNAGGVDYADVIARWNTVDKTWYPLGRGLKASSYALTTFVTSMAIYDNFLYVVGDFNQAINSDGSIVTVNGIAVWDIGTETWSDLDGGVSPILGGALGPYSVSVDDIGNVYIGGRFNTVGGVTVNNIAKWNISTSDWEALGTGADTSVKIVSYNNGFLYAAGPFSSMNGISVNQIAKCNLSTGIWSTLGAGLDGSPFGKNPLSMAINDNKLYVGGVFTLAGGEPANRIAVWDITGGTWGTLGKGVDNPGSSIFEKAVNSIQFINNDVYLGGDFTIATNSDDTTVECNKIVKWNHISEIWENLSGPSGNGTNNNVFALLPFTTDGYTYMYTGGQFTTAGGIDAKYIAQYGPV